MTTDDLRGPLDRHDQGDRGDRSDRDDQGDRSDSHAPIAPGATPPRTPATPLAAPPDAPPAAPPDALPARRILSLDVLRGGAVLGILLMNILSFGMIDVAAVQPGIVGDEAGLDAVLWQVGHLFVEMKFMTLFSLMFGASLLLIADRARARGESERRVLTRRQLSLALIGLAHAYLLWVGDILFPYAVCGVVVYLLRRRRARTQLVWGIVFYALGSGVLVLGMAARDSEALHPVQEELTVDAEEFREDLELYRGSWAEIARERVPKLLEIHLAMMPLQHFWMMSGLMLLGAALFRWGVLSAERSDRFYLGLVLVGAAIGLPLAQAGLAWNGPAADDLLGRVFLQAMTNYVASPFVALAWIGVVMLVCRTVDPSRLVPLARTGRMALSNYLGQTLIGTTLFYGYGFGLYGRLERSELWLVVVAIWMVQIAVSHLWLGRFRYGPAEWVWRAATYGRWPRMRGAAV